MLLRSQKSNEDIDKIWLYIALDNQHAADNFVDEIYKKYDLLERNPLIGRINNSFNLTGREIRQFPIGNYIIFYAQIKDGVEILRIIHGAMDFDDLENF